MKKNTGYFFNWESGTASHHIIKKLKELNIAWCYNKYGTLTADFYGIGIFNKVDYNHIEGDKFEIVMIY